MIDKAKLDLQLMLNEGVRYIPYHDTKGFLTVGVGRNLDTNPLTPEEMAQIGHDGRTHVLTHEGAILLLHNDEDKAIASLDGHLPWWKDLDDARGRVMVDLCFNMGIIKLLGFHTFLRLMQYGKYDAAADDLEGTAWYDEVGNRGPRIVGMVETGEDYTS